MTLPKPPRDAPDSSDGDTDSNGRSAVTKNEALKAEPQDAAPPDMRTGLAVAEALLAAMEAAETPVERHRLETAALEPLSTGARIIALCLLGPTTSQGDDVAAVKEAFAARSRALISGADLLEQALAGNVRDIRSLERLWHDLRYGPAPVSFAVASTLAVAGELPLAVVEPRYLAAISDQHVVSLIGLAAGNAARAGCGQARGFALKTLIGYELAGRARATCIGLLKGLGGGLMDEGLRWVCDYSQRTLLKRREWSDASLTAALLAVQVDAEPLEPLAWQSLQESPNQREAEKRLETLLEHCTPTQAEALFEALISQWTRWPAVVRAALLARRGVADSPAHAAWTRDRSAVVALEALGQLDGLGDDRNEDVLRALLGLLDHPHPDVRRRLTALLVAQRTMREPRSLPTPAGAQIVTLPPTLLARSELDRLRAAIFTGDSELVEEIVARLGDDDRAVAVDELMAAMEIPDMALRRSAIAAVGQIGTAAMGPALIDAAQRFRTLEGLVASALKQLGADDQVEALGEVFARRLKWADDQALADFCALAGDKRAPYLLDAIETRFYPAARAGAARAVADTRLQEGIFALRAMSLSDPQEDARLAATAGLKALGCSLPSTDELAGYALLFKPIATLDEVVQRAIEAGTSALPGIRKTLSKGSWKRRRAACEVLAAIPGDDAEETLIEVLQDLDEDVRLSALQALSKRGWAPKNARGHSLAAIAARQPASLLKDPDRLDVATLESALRLGGHVFRNEVIDVLERVDGWEPSDAIAATVAVTRLDGRGALDHEGGLDAVMTALDRTWQEIPHRARLTRALHELSTPALAKLASRKDLGWRAREALCRALARPGDDLAAAVATRFVHDDDDDVRKSALQALTRVGTATAAQGCAKGAESPFREDRKPAASAMAAIGEPALPLMRELAASPWWEERHIVASALHEWRGDLRDAADILVVLATDPVHRVSQVAHEALEQHGIQPRSSTFTEVLGKAQVTTVSRLEQWLGMGPTRALTDPEACKQLEVLLDAMPDERLAQRVGLIARLRAAPLTDWLKQRAHSPHFGIRLAAAEALRSMAHLTCHLCEGRGSIGCPGCNGEGEQVCVTCDGSGMARIPCPEPDCNAHETTRAIDSLPCKTCRGRGAIAAPCESCSAGAVTCSLCHGSGRNRCPLCDGSGEPWKTR